MHNGSIESYFPDFPVKREMNQAYRSELNARLETMHRRMAAGENLEFSAQIFKEVHWLVNYTDRVEDTERRIEDLRKSMADRGQTFAGRQDSKDGSFGPQFEGWIWRFFGSVESLKELARRGEKPEVPLKIWEPVDTPEKIETLLRGLLISDAGSGHNKRKELNLTITALGQLLWLDDTASVFPEHLDRAALAEALRRFVDEEWQDRETGYWGAWYRENGEIKKTNDLSITFHIISYRRGQVERLRQIADTTFAIRSLRYPYGWESGGAQNNHHIYNVSRIINLTRSELTNSARCFAEATLSSMKALSLTTSIDRNGNFDSRPYTTVAEAYYFGISFFEEVGLFGNQGSHDQWGVPTDPEDLLEKLEKNLVALHQSDPWVAAAQRKLDGLRQ